MSQPSLKQKTLNIFVFDEVRVDDSYKTKTEAYISDSVFVVCEWFGSVVETLFADKVGFARPPTGVINFSDLIAHA